MIELLVVVAVLAILAAVLLPVLLSARARARQAECQAHLGQLGSAFALYANDWGGMLPSPGGRFGTRDFWDQGNGRGLDSYLHNRTGSGSVWACPEIGPWDSRWLPRSFSMNTFLRERWDVDDTGDTDEMQSGIALADIPDSSGTILLFEGIQQTSNNPNRGRGYVFRSGNWTHVRGYSLRPRPNELLADRPWHGAVDNFLFTDGRVRAMPPDPREPHRPARGRDYWHVRKQW